MTLLSLLLISLGFFPSSALADRGDRTEFVMAAIGDSITKGFKVGERRNWSTGKGLDESHYNRIKRMGESRFGRRQFRIKAINEARVGAKIRNDILSQAKKLRGEDLDYVTILMGANDVCRRRLRFERIERQLKRALDLLTDNGSNNTIVMISAIPDIAGLQERQPLNRRAICRASWKLMCPKLSRLGAEEFRQQQKTLNQLLYKVSQRYPQVVFDRDTREQRDFSERHVASDCFHPSRDGHRLLSKALWRKVHPKIDRWMRQRAR